MSRCTHLDDLDVDAALFAREGASFEWLRAQAERCESCATEVRRFEVARERMSSAVAHPGADLLARYQAGAPLSEGDIGSIEFHARRCPDCRLGLKVLARASVSRSRRRPGPERTTVRRRWPALLRGLRAPGVAIAASVSAVLVAVVWVSVERALAPTSRPPRSGDMAALASQAVALSAVDGLAVSLSSELRQADAATPPTSVGAPCRATRTPGALAYCVTIDERFLQYSASSIAANSGELLETFARIVTRRSDTFVGLSVYTDTTGSSAQNLERSELQARWIRDLLVSAGLPASRIEASGRGEADPIVYPDESDPSAQARNRRVELVVEISSSGAYD